MLQKFVVDVSIIIKALNEEQHIASAIESALAALDGMSGEVILADGASTDRTVEIARRYPINIVSLTDIQDRSCGAGAQLGFQYSRGRYLCLIDGDMRLHKEFLPAAIRFLEENSATAGVGGMGPPTNKRTTVRTIATARMCQAPRPHNTPIVAVAQIAAAVVRPWT
jgi:glycosyltransferase involved in cell wall biosynthesis